MGKRIDGARKLRRGLFYLEVEAFKSLEEFRRAGCQGVAGWALGLGLGPPRGGATMASCASAAVSRGSSWWDPAIRGPSVRSAVAGSGKS